MSTLWQDVRYGLRMLLKNPGFTCVAVLTLALGIGANTAIFSVINAVLLHPLPYQNPQQLVNIAATDTSTGATGIAVSFTKFVQIRDQTQVLESVAANLPINLSMTTHGQPEQIAGARVSADFFRVLSVTPARGRTFLPQEDAPGAAEVAVISDAFWHNHFGGDPAVLGMTITLDGQSATVVGILPPDFRFPFQQPETDVWLPRVFDYPTLRPEQIHSGAGYLFVLGRLRPGRTMAQAQAEIDAVNDRYKRAFAGFADAPRLALGVTSLTDSLVGSLRPSLLALLAAVGFVLLIACANVASLLLARAAARSKEVAIRRALGASGARLVRQLLTESVLLSLMGGALGVLLAAFCLPLLRLVDPTTLPRADAIRMDGAVLLASLLLCALTGLTFGLTPAWQATRKDMHGALKEGGRGSTAGGSGSRVRAFMVVAEVAVALLLVAGAGLLIRSFANLQHVNPGFDASNVLTFPITLPAARYTQRPRQAELFRQLVERVRNLPGVQSAAVVTDLPLTGATRFVFFCPEGHVCEGLGKDPLIACHQASAQYFQTMRIPLLRGRVFTDQDNASSPRVVVINQTVAKRYFPGQDPLGKHIANSRDKVPMQIIGVVADVKFNTLNYPDGEEMYLPQEQVPWPAMTLVVRSTLGARPLIAAVRQQALALDPDLPLTGVLTMDQVAAASVSQPKLIVRLVGGFAAFALLLAAIGIYGVMAYAVTQRSHEIGIRLALGATPRHVLRLLLGQGMRLVLAGAAAGLTSALLLTRLLNTLLFGTTATDPLILGGVTILLMAVALAACYLPARRAMRVDPLIALRYE